MEDNIKILQQPISDNHLDAMFFNGLVAIGKNKNNHTKYYVLTIGSNEIQYKGVPYVEKDFLILSIEKGINDDDIELANHNEHKNIDILVDNFFALVSEDDYKNLENLMENDSIIMYGYYDEVIGDLKKFVNE